MLPNRVPLLSADRPTVAANFLASTSIPSWLTHSRAGGAMQYDSTGKLTWAPENILPYSNTFSSGWAALSTGTYVIDGTNYADPDGGTSATQLTWSGAGNAYIGQSITAGRSDGATYFVSIWARIVSGSGDVNIRLFGLTKTGQALTSSWQRFTWVDTAGTSSAQLSFIFPTGSVVQIYQAQACRVTYQTANQTYYATGAAGYFGPRFDYDPVTLAAKGLLVEESRTNLLTYSSDFNATGWTDTNITRVSATRTSPSGLGNALEVSASAANGTVIKSAAVGSSALRTFSIWLKRVSGTGNIQYTLDNGGSWTTQAITSDWVRYEFTATTADQQVGIRIVTSGDTIQMYGPQLEAGSFATSYIPTSTASVTRAADGLQVIGAGYTAFTSGKGSVILQFQGVGFAASSDRLLGGQNSGYGYMAMGFDGPTPAAAISWWNGSTEIITTGGSEYLTTPRRCGIAFDDAAPLRRIANTGSAVLDSATDPVANDASSLYIGKDGGGTQQANIWLQGAVIYNKTLTAAQLASKLTVNGSY